MNIRQLAKESYKESNYSKDNPMYWHLWKRAFDRAWVMFGVESKDQRIKELQLRTIELEVALKTIRPKLTSDYTADCAELIDKVITPNPSKITTKN